MMDETDLDDLNEDQIEELEQHLYSIVHHNECQNVELKALDTVDNVINALTVGKISTTTVIPEKLITNEIEEITVEKQSTEDKHISDTEEFSKYKINMNSNLNNNIISIDSSDSEDEVIEIKQPSPPLICIDESSSDEEFDNSLNADKCSGNTNFKAKQHLNTNSVFIAPKAHIASSMADKSTKRCASPTSIASDDFIQNDCDALINKSELSFMFNAHHPEVNVSTSSCFSNYVARSDSSSDCSELPTNHSDIFVHAEDTNTEIKLVPNTSNSDSSACKNIAGDYEVFKDVSPKTVDIAEHDSSIESHTQHNLNKFSSTPIRTKNKTSGAQTIVKVKSKRNVSRKPNILTDMEEFYNKSWGGETFDHNLIISKMSSDKNCWAVSHLDKRRYHKEKGWRNIRCRNCNQMGHGVAQCVEPKRVVRCYMCGMAGHAEPRCPNKMCLRCGSPSPVFNIGCKNCARSINHKCQLCFMIGHYQDQCPDLWRRYHRSIDCTKAPVVNPMTLKVSHQLYCSNCSSRGHLYHDCRKLKATEHSLTNPIINQYSAVYPIECKAQSKPNTISGILNPSTTLGISNLSGLSECVSNSVSNQNNCEEIRNFDARTDRNGSKRKSNASDTPSKQCKLNENTFLNGLNNFEAIDSEDSFEFVKSTDCSETQNVSEQMQCLNQIDLEESESNVESDSKVKLFFTHYPQLSSVSHTTQDNSVTSSDKSFTISDKNVTSSYKSATKYSKIVTSFKNSVSNSNKNVITSTNEEDPSADEIVINSLLMDKETITMLMKKEGAAFLQNAMKTFDIAVQIQFSSIGGSLLLTGCKAQQVKFQDHLKDWIKQINKQMLKSSYTACLPRKVSILCKMLKQEISLLSKGLGTPVIPYSAIKNIEQSTLGIMSSKQIKQYNRNLRKLNMCLFGRSGCRDGQLHLRELSKNIAELERLAMSMQVTPRHVYDEVKVHYDYIFSPMDHGNYEELINERRHMLDQCQFQTPFTSRNLHESKNKSHILPNMFPSAGMRDCTIRLEPKVPNNIPIDGNRKYAYVNRNTQNISHEISTANRAYLKAILASSTAMIDNSKCSKTMKQRLRKTLNSFREQSTQGYMDAFEVAAFHKFIKSLRAYQNC